MEFIVKNWYVFIAFISSMIIIDIFIYRFFKQPTTKQVESVKKWLLYAVTKAEKELGANTGQLKLHTVYDLFLNRFSLTFAVFAVCERRRFFMENFEVILSDIIEMIKKGEIAIAD